MPNEPCQSTDPCHEAKVVQSPEDLRGFIFGDERHVGPGFGGAPDPDPDGDLIDAIEAEEARQCSEEAEGEAAGMK